jgi:hypothetical protein
MQLTLEQAKTWVTQAEMLERLERNRDFKKLFTEGLLRDEAVRLVHVRKSAETDAETRVGYDSLIDAIGELNDFLRSIKIKGEAAAKALAAYDRDVEQHGEDNDVDAVEGELVD